MNINEKARLENTIRVVDEKIKENTTLQKYLKEKLSREKRDFSLDYSDAERGGDLSSYINDIAQTQQNLFDQDKEFKRLSLQRKNPYFARIDFTLDGKEKEQNIYIGIANVFDKQDLLVVDWRTPIASIYYDYNLGRASFKIEETTYHGNLDLKRQYKIENAQLISYFDTDLTINDDILKELLSKNTSTKMKQIASSIQSEQNKIIRSNTSDNMLVQGIAGSGKTSIALHRAAYLLYKHKDMIKSNDICIISPNNVFSSYISEVLPQLGEDNIAETTFTQIVKSELKMQVQPRELMLDEIATNPTQKMLNEISYKSSYEYLDSLLRFLKGPFVDTYTPQTLSYVVAEDMDGNKETIDFPAERTKELFFKTFKGLDLYERINKIAWHYTMFFAEKRHYTKQQQKDLKERFKKILYNFLPIKKVEKIFQIFMEREGLSYKDNGKIQYMDKGAYLVIKHYLYGFSHDLSAKYLIIDEMQDFTPVDIYMFKKIWNCPMIVVGDVNQCIEKNVSDEYLQLTADFLGCKLVKINKTYRSTKEIALFANHLVGLDDIEFINRSGGEPIVYQSKDQIQAIADYINSQCQELEHIAVICKCNKEAVKLQKDLKKVLPSKLLENPEDYENRILVTTCATAKGIEFDAVIIPNADDQNYRNTIDKNIIYVSSTRALHKLAFTTSGEPSRFIKNLQVKNG